jgi:hypothetical protein
MSFSQGMPWFPEEALSWIRPARPTVCPSCTTTRDWMERWKKVGEVMPCVVGVVVSMLLTCREMSR